MSKINKWRIYCIEEDTWTYGWVDNEDPTPTKCFNNIAHSVNSQSVNIIDFVSNNEVSISEEKIKTQGNFRTEGFQFDIPANTTYTYTHVIPYSINLLAIWFTIKSENIDDILNAYYEPGINGIIQSNITLPINILTIDEFFIGFLNVGFVVVLERISDNYTENLGEILSIDKVNNQITTTNYTSENFNINDKVKIKINGVKNTILGHTGRHSIGSSKVGATYLSSSGKLTATYQNKSMTDQKSFIYELEYLY